jgi:alanine racemase
LQFGTPGYEAIVINLYDILEACNGQLFGEPAAHIFTDFCFDSRRAQESQLFVALKTERQDTHQYMREAVERGVTGVLCTQPPDFDTENLSVVLVRDTEAALMNWTRYILQKMGAQVICVSGTAGKSLTVEAIRKVLSTQYKVHSGDDHELGRLGLPLTLAHLNADHQFVVLELEVTRPGMMNEYVQVVQPDVVVVPSVGPSYMDTFSDTLEIIAEKRLLLDRLAATSLAVLNSDDESVRMLLSATRARVMTFAVESFGADMIAYNVVAGADKTGFDLRFGGDRHVGRWVPWLGRHQLGAALAGLCVGLHYDVPLEEGLKALTELTNLPGRMNPLIGFNDSLLIDDSSSATPRSVQLGLDWLRNQRSQQDENGESNRRRLMFVMGDLDHLGGQTLASHRAIGQQAAHIADVIVTQGTQAAQVARAAMDAGKNQREVVMTYSAQDAAAALRDRFNISPLDTILVTGSASARMETVVAELLKHDTDLQALPRKDSLGESAAKVGISRLNWVEVDLDSVANNVRGLKRLVGDQVALMAVVKADAYGHGAVAVARTALLNGADQLAVSSVNEAVELRDSGIEAPILLLNFTPLAMMREAIRQRLKVTLYDLDSARVYDRLAREVGEKVPVHIKVDTGMGRMGVMVKETMALFRHLYAMKNLEVEGIYTHFASADDDPEFTALQVKTFKDTIKPLRAAGFNFRYIHAANSAGTLATQENHFNMVRCGLALYGLSPSESVRVPADFRTALTWKTMIAQVKTLPPGHSVGYGRAYITKSEERIAILPVGYADGFRRAPNNWGEVLIHGQRAPLVGRVSMEKAAINVTHIPNVTVGDEVVLLGRQGADTITADEVAARWGTINYEVVTSILPRVSRR